MRTMGVVAACLVAALAGGLGAGEREGPPGDLAVPTAEQLAWQDLEYGLFVHFGINTFHDTEWSDGTLRPQTFHPQDFDADQWARAAKSAGMNYLVLTAKHHDGFCLFPTETTDYGVESSPWRDGKSDVVRDVARACRKHGLEFGVYLSPWDRHCPFYHDEGRYDDYYKTQLTELLTRYGPVAEVWWDGAGTQGHTYGWAGYRKLVRELQPKALIAIAGQPDIRWVGNEKGLAPDPCWSFVEVGGEQVWRPAECDVPLRDTWFWRTDNEDTIKTLDRLVDIYHRSVGHGANLLVNVGADRLGTLPDADVERLKMLWMVISDMTKTDFAQGRQAIALSFTRGGEPAKAVDGDPDTAWQTEVGIRQATLEVELGRMREFNRAVLMENIALGQRIRRYVLEHKQGVDWRPICEGTAVGHKKINVFPPVYARHVRLRITEAVAAPGLRTFALHHCAYPYRKHE
ncbi:MAG: alpha-L-fucosidase [bacterium]